MTRAADLSLEFADELRGFGASLPEDFAAAATALEPRLSEARLEDWARAGMELAHASLRSWEAAAEYFRASPVVIDRLGEAGMTGWVRLASDLSQKSSLMAAAFLKSTPAVLDLLPPAELEAWSQQGERLCRGNWKSIALSALYFQVSPELLKSMPLPSVNRLIDIIDQLTERSYELATNCLESSPAIFAAVAPADREPFLNFARAVTRASWADTRLYFERGPKMLAAIAPERRTAFLDLAARVTLDVGRQGFPLFADAAQSLATMPPETHGDLLAFSSRLAAGSPGAAMEYLKSAPFIRTRLTPEQMVRWSDMGAQILEAEHNPEGAEAYFRLESQRAEEMLAALSARVELQSVNGLLRMYAKALSGESVAVMSSENLVDRNIGWVTSSGPTTEGTSIYLPPFVATFEDREENFQVYKVFTTHQTGRMEFGSFAYVFDAPGEHAPAKAGEREARIAAERVARDAIAGVESKPAVEAATPMQRFFNLFAERPLILGIFTVIEDTRVDAMTAREYGGIRRSLRHLQSHEAQHRPAIETMGLRQAYVENLLRASLGAPEEVRWPRSMQQYMTEGLAALKLAELEGATVQDSAEIAAAIYDIAVRIPNVSESSEADGKFDTLAEEFTSMAPAMPSGESGDVEMPQGDEMDFENPPQPEFRGDFKPELVQLLSRMKQMQEGGDSEDGEALTKEQLMELLQNSAELDLDDFSQDELENQLGMFLDNLEKEANAPTGDPEDDANGNALPDGGKGDADEADLPVQIDWFYYDEWDFRASDYRPRWARVGERISQEGGSDFYEETLRRYHGLVMETRRQFEMMRPESFKKYKRLEDGDELDLDLAIEFQIDKRAGIGPQARIYNRRNKIERDVAVAFLLDMSASTDEEIEKPRQRFDGGDDDKDFTGDPRQYFQWLAARRARNNTEPPKRIIDLEKESTVLIVEALEAIGDSYGIYGFSGYGRDNVEFHVIKDLDEQMSERVKHRIDKIEPIRSTRMGPAIRHTIHKLDEFAAKVKILILVSDGRPQDHGYGRDRTEKEYAVHDTKQALLEAKHSGITPFLITVDREGHDYLKQMCDDIGYEVVDEIESLPRRLPTLYRHLAAD